MNVQELRQQSVEELNQSLLKLGRELFNLRIQKSTGQLNQTHLLRQTKRNIAQVKTMLVEKTAAGERA